MFLCPAPPTSPDRRPSGKHGVKELPPSSLDSFLSLVLQPPPPDDAGRRVPDKRPFARTLNGQIPPRYSLWIPVLPGTTLVLRVPLWIPACAGMTLGRASAVWLAFVGGAGICSASEPCSYNGLRDRFSAAFRPVFSDVFQDLWRVPSVDPCVGGSVWSRPRPDYLYSVVFVQRLRKVELDLSRRGDSSFSVRWSECTRIGACCLYYYICSGSQVEL